MKKSQATLNSLLHSPNSEYYSLKRTPIQEPNFMISPFNSQRQSDTLNKFHYNSTSNNQTQTKQDQLFDNFVYQDNLFNFKLTQKEIKQKLQQKEKVFQSLNQSDNISFYSGSSSHATPRLQLEQSSKKQLNIYSLNNNNFQKNVRQFIDIKELIRHPLICKKKHNDLNQSSNIDKQQAKLISSEYREACNKTFHLEKQQFKQYINNQCRALNPKIKQLSNQKISQLNERQLRRFKNQLDQIKTEPSQSQISSLEQISDIDEEEKEQEELNKEMKTIDYIGEMKKELDDAGFIGRHNDFILNQSKKQKKLIKRIKEDFQKRQQIIEEEKKQEEIKMMHHTQYKSHRMADNQNKIRFINQLFGESSEYIAQKAENICQEQQLEQMKPHIFRQCLAKYSHLKIRNLSYLVQPVSDKLSNKDLKIGNNLKYIIQLNKLSQNELNSKQKLLEGVSTIEDTLEKNKEINDFSANLNNQLQQTKQKLSISMKKKEQKLFSAIKNSENVEIQYLLNLYPNLINSLNKRGDTPLIYSVKYCNSHIVEELIKRGSNLNAQNIVFTFFIKIFIVYIYIQIIGRIDCPKPSKKIKKRSDH
ncbi:hypothetical protein ABPG72_004735 [Tetrahymena utriculariae]